MNQDVFNKIVGKGKLQNAMRDSDGDGYGNLVDCQPYNPKKQGWIHDIKNKIGEKIEEHKHFKAEENEAKFVARSKAIEAGREERIKQAQVTERYKIQQQAAQERKQIAARYSGKGSSGFGSFISGISNVSNAMVGTTPRTSAPRATKRKVVTYVKKGKHYVKRTSYKPVRTGTGQGNVKNNTYQMPNVLGTNLRF